METLPVSAIAAALGVDAAVAKNTQDWQPDTHAYTISELIVGDQAIPFRVKDMATNEVWTKILTEPYIVDPAKVDSIFADVMAIQVLKNGNLIPAITNALYMAGTSHVTMDKNGELVLQTYPVITVDPKSGNLVVDLSPYSEQANALAAKSTQLSMAAPAPAVAVAVAAAPAPVDFATKLANDISTLAASAKSDADSAVSAIQAAISASSFAAQITLK